LLTYWFSCGHPVVAKRSLLPHSDSVAAAEFQKVG
jgi:hypothetical protein